ncbi:hypothetical protein [Paludisphaera mucosa]|uniref:Uncharacterized protein n=1 Tax=Paludisphaera mucosa TaxID=3030827 RepID=A0ABT6FEG9_9BACT|nr:hypothetical protein [Paludisphaera mucosa]MDG3005977.1 hypothetical protein [Paludisphaera mucosa]
MLRQKPVVTPTDPVPTEPVAAPAVEEDEWNWQGAYDLDPVEPPRPMSRALDRANPRGPLGPWPDQVEITDEPEVPEEPAPPAEATDGEWSWQGNYELGEEPRASVSVQGAPEPQEAVEGAETRPPLAPLGRNAKRESEDAEPQRLDPWFPPHLLYPARGFEGLAMVAAIGGVAWVMGTLGLEYCLAILADGELMGVSSMGRLIALISSLPFLIISPLVLVYGIQYLARVLVASSEGELLPPRPPDRSADGLLDGIGSWLLWIVLGAGVGLLPLATYRAALGESWSPGVAAALGPFGLSYALMALMLTFLHDDDLAARPWTVLGTMARLGPSFLGLSLTVAALFALVGIAFAAALALRDRAFWVYIPASLASWLLAAWLSIVAMHTLGAYYAPRRNRLKWRRKRHRWGAR